MFGELYHYFQAGTTVLDRKLVTESNTGIMNNMVQDNDENRAHRDASAPASPELKPTMETVAEAGTTQREDAEENEYVYPIFQNCEKRYQDKGELGRGGMGSVRRVLDHNLFRTVAMKVIHPHRAEKPKARQRFIEEAQIMGQLEHQGIAPVYDLNTNEKGQQFLSMKLIRGQNLGEAVDQMGESRLEPSTLASLLRTFLKICEAVAFAHNYNVLHRDLKPVNVMLGDFGQVYVMDWGLAQVIDGDDDDQDEARVTRPSNIELIPSNTPVGTPQYMAPEQVHRAGEGIDKRTDIFGLGTILYYIVTGRPPYHDTAMAARLYKAFQAKFPRPSQVVESGIPPELEAIILKAMAREPSDRYLTVEDLHKDVERFLHSGWSFPSRTYQAGEKIVTEDESGDEAFIITEGRCQVLKGEGEEPPVIRALGPGEVFGETAVFSDKTRTATVVAETEVTVMVVTKDVMSEAVNQHRWFGTFVKALADRFREVDDRLRELERQGK